MKVEVTKELLASIRDCVDGKRNTLGTLRYSDAFKQDNKVGEVIRESVERGAQHVDVVEGWLKRVEEQCESSDN